MKNNGCRKSLHKIVKFVVITPLFWVHILYNFLAILTSKWSLFLQLFAVGKCKARKGQLQITCGNMIDTEYVITEY